MEIIRQRIDSTSAGQGQTLFISGESGIGKTQLVLEALREGSSRGFILLRGRCLYQERGLPYHPLAEALRGIFNTGGTGLLESFAKNAAAKGIDSTGRLGSIKAFLRLSADPVSFQNKEQLWDAVHTLLRILSAERPIALMIDDLQWADRETITLFTFLARNSTRDRTLLVGLYRNELSPGEQTLDISMLRDSIRQLRIEGVAAEISLARLTEKECTALLRELFDAKDVDPALARRVFAVTEGNPLFISELVGLMKARNSVEYTGDRWRLRTDAGEVEIPDRVNDVIAQRLVALDPGDRELLEAASCDGDHFDSETVAACMQADRLPVLRRLQGIENSHALVHYDRSRYRFDHPIIRQVLYRGILPELREEYHRLIADRLLSRTPEEATIASRIAHHLLHSSQESRAPEYLIRGGDHARDLYAIDEASEQYERAEGIVARHPSAPPVLLLRLQEGLGDVATARGKTRDALDRYSRMTEMARKVEHREKEIESLRKSSGCLRILGETEKALAVAHQALELARGHRHRREESECLHAIASIHTARGEYDRTILRSQEALAIAQELSDHRLAAMNLVGLGLAGMHTGEYRMALQWLTEAKAVQEYAGDRRGLADTFNALALVTDRLARYEEALSDAEASLQIKRDIGDVSGIPGGLNIIGDIHRDSGNIAAACEYHTQSLALAREHANRGSQCDNLRDLGADYLLLADPGQSRRCLEEVLSIARSGGYLWHETRATITMSELQVAEGSSDGADETSRRGLDLARSLKAQELIVEALWKRALVLERLARTPEALAHLQEAIDLSSASGHRIFLWQIETDFGRFLQAAGRAEDAAPVLASADRHIREIGDQFLDAAARERFLAWGAIRRGTAHG
jgi:predicted ATPase